MHLLAASTNIDNECLPVYSLTSQIQNHLAKQPGVCHDETYDRHQQQNHWCTHLPYHSINQLPCFYSLDNPNPKSCHRYISGCVVECRICNREVAGSNLSLGYFAPPRSTQPSIPPGSVNEYQLRLERQRQVWLIPIADECVGVQVKLWNPLRTRATPECFCGGDSLWRGAISSVCTFTFYLTFTSVVKSHWCLLGSDAINITTVISAVWHRTYQKIS